MTTMLAMQMQDMQATVRMQGGMGILGMIIFVLIGVLVIVVLVLLIIFLFKKIR